MVERLEGSVDPFLVPVLRREVRRCELNQVPVLNKETKICLLMTDKAKLVAAHVNGAPLHSNFPEKGVTENNHHGVVGRRSQPDWGVVAALLQGEPDEEPWISASGLGRRRRPGAGWAPCPLKDLGVVIPGEVSWWGTSTVGDERSSEAPGAVLGNGRWCGVKR
jgi:hypothetical protein